MKIDLHSVQLQKKMEKQKERHRILKLLTIGTVIKENFLKLILMKKQEHEKILHIRKD